MHHHLSPCRQPRSQVRWLGLLALGILASQPNAQSKPWDAGRLSVSKRNPHFFALIDQITGEETPFFLSMDTGWCGGVRLTWEEIDDYVAGRRRKGFNGVMMCITMSFNPTWGWNPAMHGPGPGPYGIMHKPAGAHPDPVNKPWGNAYGFIPFEWTEGPEPTPNGIPDPTKPIAGPGANDDFWDTIDYFVDRCEAEGLFVALLPLWGATDVNSRWTAFPAPNHKVPARAYGEFLGTRFGDREHVIWVAGGDQQDPWPLSQSNFRKRDAEIYHEIMMGIEATERVPQLKTFHPSGSSASYEYRDFVAASSQRRAGYPDWNAWMDFDTYQTQDWPWAEYQRGENGYNRSVVMPVLNSEPRYSDDWIIREDQRHGYVERRALYYGACAGNAGHVYGSNPVWYFYQPGDRDAIRHRGNIAGGSDLYWREAMDRTAHQMRTFQSMLGSRRMDDRVPDRGVVYAPDRHPVSNSLPFETGLRGDFDGSGKAGWALAYFPAGAGRNGVPPRLDFGKISGSMAEVYFIDPRTGEALFQGRFANTGQQQAFDLPGSYQTPNEWIVFLQDAARRYGPPVDEGVNVNPYSVTAPFEVDGTPGGSFERIYGSAEYTGGSVSSDTNVRLVRTDNRYGDQTMVLGIGPDQPISSWVGVIVRADDEDDDWNKPTGSATLIYCVREAGGYRVIGRKSDGTAFAGDLVNYVFDTAGYTLRLSAVGDTVTAYINNQLSLRQGGFDNPLGGGFTSLRINTVGTGPLSIRYAELRRYGEVPNVHVDSAGNIWVSLVRDGGLIPDILAKFSADQVSVTWNGRRMDYDYWLSEVSRLPWITVEAFDPESILLYGARGIPSGLSVGGRLEHEYGAFSFGQRIR